MGILDGYLFNAQADDNVAGPGWLGARFRLSAPLGLAQTPAALPSANMPARRLADGLASGQFIQPTAFSLPLAAPAAAAASLASSPALPPPGKEMLPPSPPLRAPLDIRPPLAPPAGLPSGGAAMERGNPLTALLTGIGNGVAGLFGPGAPHNPNLLDRLTAGATNLTTGGNPIAGVLNAVNGLATGQRTDRAGVALAQQQATMSALMNAGLDLKTARAAAINPDYLKALVMARLTAKPAPQQAGAAPRQAQQPARYVPRLANPAAPGTLPLYVDENGQLQIVPHR